MLFLSIIYLLLGVAQLVTAGFLVQTLFESFSLKAILIALTFISGVFHLLSTYTSDSNL